MTAQIILLRPSLQDWHTEDLQENCGYAFLRLEHECEEIAGFWKRGLGCDLDTTRLAIGVFVHSVRKLLVGLCAVNEKDFRTSLAVARHQASQVAERLNEIEHLPLTDDSGAEYIMADIENRLRLMRTELHRILPVESPFGRKYQRRITMEEDEGSA